MKIDKKIILAIVLGVLAVGVVLYQLRGTFSSGKSGTAGVIPKPPSAVASAAQTPSVGTGRQSPSTGEYAAFIAKIKESDITFKSRKLKNPMTPLVEKLNRDQSRAAGPATKVVAPLTDARSMGYSIEGIVWNDFNPLALVNNQVVGIGEKLDDGALITTITQDTVRFTRNGMRYYLVLREE